MKPILKTLRISKQLNLFLKSKRKEWGSENRYIIKLLEKEMNK